MDGALFVPLLIGVVDPQTTVAFFARLNESVMQLPEPEQQALVSLLSRRQVRGCWWRKQQRLGLPFCTCARHTKPRSGAESPSAIELDVARKARRNPIMQGVQVVVLGGHCGDDRGVGGGHGRAGSPLARSLAGYPPSSAIVVFACVMTVREGHRSSTPMHRMAVPCLGRIEPSPARGTDSPAPPQPLTTSACASNAFKAMRVAITVHNRHER